MTIKIPVAAPLPNDYAVGMDDKQRFEIFLAVVPGLEAPLASEATSLGFGGLQTVPGGLTFQGTWRDVWRANLHLRGASRVLARIGAFRAMHLAQLDKRARKFPWAETLRADVPVKVEAVCRKSRIYHAGAAAQRIATALTDTHQITVSDAATLRVMVRIEDDLCSISLDTSGDPLHRRGHKQAVGKAPMRETMAAMFLHECGYRGHEPVLDPMCGSGTFVIEAAEMALGLPPGRSRRFAFEDLATFNAAAFAAMQPFATREIGDLRFFGSDRDQGAVQMASANADRAGVAGRCGFQRLPVSDLVRPLGPPGLVIVNPPYGGRIGDKKLLFGLHGALGKVLLQRFQGWRVGLITNEASLAQATGLPFLAPGPIVAHGGLKVRLYQTGALGPP